MMSRIYFRFLCIALFAGSLAPVVRAEILLDLPFDGSLTGSQGESPVDASGVAFVAGFKNGAASFSGDSLLTYESSGNINAFAGTLEFLVRPNWDGNDEVTHTFLEWGVGGGMLFAKDGANNIRAIFNRYGPNGNPETGESEPISAEDWKAGEWHHLAFTWDNSAREIKVYVDGVLRNTGTFSFDLPTIDASIFRIGGQSTAPGDLDGALDALRIHGVALTNDEIAARYQALSVPEPSSVILVGLGAAALLGLKRKARRRAA